MYTEDDTFRVLSRPGFDEMMHIHNQWRRLLSDRSTIQRIPFMKQYKWSWSEFVLEAARLGRGAEVE